MTLAYPAKAQIRSVATDFAAWRDPERLVCGLCASLDGGKWKAAQFSRFLAWFGGGHDGELIPLRADHVTARWPTYARGSGDIGECLDFASVTGDGFGGLLVLAALYEATAPQILRDMRNGRWRAMSVRGAAHRIPGQPGDLWVTEVSLVSKVGEQLDPGALVIGTGRAAVEAWELLSGRAPVVTGCGMSCAVPGGLRPGARPAFSQA